jgi:hypothetical protein
MTIPDAAVWEVCDNVTLEYGETCKQCPAQISTPYGPATQACYVKACEAIREVQRAMAGCETKGDDNQ